MLVFLIFTVIFLIANVGMGKFMLIAISPEQLFDKLFGWQNMLRGLYGGSAFKSMLGKLLGDCNVCFLHLISIINFTFYVVFMTIGLDRWVIGNNIIVNIVWYFVYVSIAWYSSFKININEKAKEA